jgi:2TM domain
MPTTKLDTATPEYQSALKQVREMREFYRHVASYVTVVTILFLINLVTSRGYWWFYWVAFFWGIGVIMHGFTFFVFRNMMSKDWEDAQVSKIINRNK